TFALDRHIYELFGGPLATIALALFCASGPVRASERPHHAERVDQPAESAECHLLPRSHHAAAGRLRPVHPSLSIGNRKMKSDTSSRLKDVRRIGVKIRNVHGTAVDRDLGMPDALSFRNRHYLRRPKCSLPCVDRLTGPSVQGEIRRHASWLGEVCHLGFSPIRIARYCCKYSRLFRAPRPWPSAFA